MAQGQSKSSAKAGRVVEVGGVSIGGDNSLALIAGLNVIESKDATIETAAVLKEAAKAAGLGLIFKASFDKANRSAVQSYRGPGLEKGLEILASVKKVSVKPYSPVIFRIGRVSMPATFIGERK